MPDSLQEIIHDMIVSGPVPAKALAERLGKPYPTLMREANPLDDGAKLGVELLVPIMDAQGIGPIHYLARRYKHIVIPEPCGEEPMTPNNCMLDLAECTAQLGTVADHLVKSLKDVQLDRQECLDAFEHITTCISRLNSFAGKAMAGARQ